MVEKRSIPQHYAEIITKKIDEFDKILSSATLENLISIAMSRGSDFAEIYFEYAINNAVALEENKLKQAQMGVTCGVGIRVLSGEKTGYTYSDSLDYDHLKQAAKTASYIAENATTGSPVRLNASPEKSINISPIELYPLEVAIKEKSALLWRANEAGYSADERIKQVNTSFADSIKFYRIANSEGIFIDNQESLCRMNVSVVAEKDNKRQSGYHGGGGRVDFSYYNKLTPEDITKEAVRTALIKFDAIDAPAGPQEVVLGNGWAGVLLHEAVGHGLEADFNRKKTSLYSGRIGQKVASELCTIIDDGTIPNCRGSLNIDNEGYKTSRNVLIEKGILEGYLCDYLNARLLKTKPTGSGRRESFKFYPLPRMTNTFMLAGQHLPEEIIRSVKKGFYAKSFGGGQVDISNGQFVFEVTEGYLIENGKITAPVKGASLIGSGPQVLERVVMVGNDLMLDSGIGTCVKDGQSVPVGVGLPTCKISEITVGGTAIKNMPMTGGKV
ncbi:MAG: metalloprotease TldD [candidate division Zixibacteria bacterium 4484_95]|nr:MAG: metalloprotease TldD [candidate division Zixibacteria bacterium 4484_95]